MDDIEEFRQQAHQLVDWMAHYLQSVEKYPVKSSVKPGEILTKLPAKAPQTSESFEKIFKDFETIILPGITHWQSPSFHAYFPGNSSLPSVLGEMLTSVLSVQCMIWETSPAAAELEQRVLEWLKAAMELPNDFTGVIQDTASTATLAAILTARERVSNYAINDQGFHSNNYRVYCSAETHSSIEKAVKIAGIGKSNLVRVEVDRNMRMKPEALAEAVRKDKKKGLIPISVVASVGTTSTCAIDPIAEIGNVAQDENIWLHVDAAYAGTAVLLEECKWMILGLEKADSYVFNPHKWMFTNFDCTAFYVKDKEALIRTFEVLPEYLKTTTRGKVNDYRDWGIPLGRRFRALKLWFVIRSFGLDGIKKKLREHIALAENLARQIRAEVDFELLTPRSLNLVCFRYHPTSEDDEKKIENLNRTLLEQLNSSGNMYLTHTKIRGKYVIRMVIGQTTVTKAHVTKNWSLIRKTARQLKP